MKRRGTVLLVLLSALMIIATGWLKLAGAAAAEMPPRQQPAADGYEPDDDWWEANYLAPGVPGHHHSLSPAGDVDWITLTVLAGEWSAAIIAEKPGGGAIKMSLYDGNLTLLQTSTLDGQMAELSSSCALNPLSGGDYYVRIEEYDSAEIADYYVYWDDYEDCSKRSDLQPYTLTAEGYEYPVVPNSIKNTNKADSTLYAGKTTYFDWFFINNGPGWPPGTYYSRVWVDGDLAVDKQENPIGQGMVGGWEDWGFVVPSPGWHTVYFEVDSDDDVPERDELNNTWEMEFYWAPVNGWWAEFYNNEDLVGDPVLVRDDAVIDFDWGDGSPGPGVAADFFSARWTRKVQFDAGTYRFNLGHDDGTRFYIDGVKLYEYWDTNVADHQVIKPLSGGLHDVKFEMNEQTGWARAWLSWERCYTLDVSIAPANSGEVYIETDPNCGDDLYLEGTQVTLMAEPYSGYLFSHWSGALSGNQSQRVVTMNSNKDITANFGVECYPLNITIDTAGGGTVSKDPNVACYTYGTDVILAAAANTGYVFDHWSGGAGGSVSPVVVTIYDEEWVTAHFEPDCYELTTLALPLGGGWVERDPNQACYSPGAQVTLTAEANSDFVFDHWSGAAGGGTDQMTITMDADKTVTANFEPECYTLTTTASPSGGGWVERAPHQACYSPGTQVTLTAYANTGFDFTYWDGSIGGSDNPAIITMNGDRSVQANFGQPCHELNTGIAPAGGGNVIRSPQEACYVEGSQVTLTAEAHTGFTFSHWSGSITGSQNPQVVTIDGQKSVTAHFSQPCYSLTFDVDPAGSGSVAATAPNCGGQYLAGTEVTLEAQANGDYRFSQWSGSISGSVNPRVMVMDGDKAVTANFNRTCYSLSLGVTPGNGGWVQNDPPPNCDGTLYTEGTRVTLTAHPNNNYSFKQWAGSLESVLNPRTFTMDANKSITAVFFRTDQVGYMPAITSNPSAGLDCYPGPDESENNDMASEAGQPLCLNQGYHGLRQDEHDFFVVQLRVAGELVVRLTTDQGNAGMQLLLQSSNLELLHHDGSLKNELQVGLPAAQPGRYYIHVVTAHPDNGIYAFQVLFTPSE